MEAHPTFGCSGLEGHIILNMAVHGLGVFGYWKVPSLAAPPAREFGK